MKLFGVSHSQVQDLPSRIMGEITEEKLTTVRESDAILREEIVKAGLDRDIWQYFSEYWCSFGRCQEMVELMTTLLQFELLLLSTG